VTGGVRPPLVVLLTLASLTLAVLDRSGAARGVLEPARGAARSALVPVESALEAGLRPLGEAGDGLTRGRALARENARLRHALEASRAGSARAEALAEENRRLSELLGMPTVAGLRAMPARVVSAGTGRAGSTLLLDRGRDAGLAPGMPVVSGGALVGRVVEVWRGTAAVLPVTDPTSAVGVRLAGSGGLAVAEGRGPGAALRLDLLDPSTPVPPGEVVVTSGLRHGRYPAGLVVGRTGDGREALHLLAGLARLELVQVLDWNPPQ
jgi:rod shape-determining protein MreC